VVRLSFHGRAEGKIWESRLVCLRSIDMSRVYSRDTFVASEDDDHATIPCGGIIVHQALSAAILELELPAVTAFLPSLVQPPSTDV
jgi:hypothetical protein